VTGRVATRPPEHGPDTRNQGEHGHSANHHGAPPPRRAHPGIPTPRSGSFHRPRPGRALIHSRIVDLPVRQEQGWNYRWHPIKRASWHWWFHGSGQLHTNGNADADIHSQGTRTTCLDGDGSSRGNRAPIFQWKCNQSDIYQQWN
jgi:hypothetical protein